MSHGEDSRVRKRKRQAIESHRREGQKCIDHFFSPTGLATASRAAAAGSGISNEALQIKDVIHEHCRTEATVVPSTLYTAVRKHTTRSGQPDEQQLPDLTIKCSTDTHLSVHQGATPPICSMKASLRKGFTSLPTKVKSLPGSNLHAMPRADSGASAGPDSHAQQQLSDAFAVFTTALHERQQFRE